MYFCPGNRLQLDVASDRLGLVFLVRKAEIYD